jgi:hypothetical protein
MNMAIFFSKSQCLYYHIKVFLIHINKVYWPQFVLYIIRSLSNSTDNYLLLPIIASTDNYFLRYQKIVQKSEPNFPQKKCTIGISSGSAWICQEENNGNLERRRGAHNQAGRRRVGGC